MTDPLRVDAFDYDLPPELVAQEPAPARDGSRLMTLDRSRGVPAGLAHHRFTDLPGLLRPGDLLVLNDTRVLAARLAGRRAAPGTGGRVDALLIERAGGDDAGAAGAAGEDAQTWRALLKGNCRAGEPIDFGSGLTGVLLRRDGTAATIALRAAPGEGPTEAALQRAGRMPTPPYIRRGAAPGREAARGCDESMGPAERDPRERLDRERYQTVYARHPGALAAPTAGLHFTTGLLDAIRARGVEVETITLHVGLGTFEPVRVDRVQDHRMHAESVIVPGSAAEAVSRARRRGGRVVAVGTTVTRALEWRASLPQAVEGQVIAGGGPCDLFIHPGHRFRAVDALLTNFHLPRSTLLMLVAAFAGRRTILDAYAAAIEARYRFFSYGDAMFIH